MSRSLNDARTFDIIKTTEVTFKNYWHQLLNQVHIGGGNFRAYLKYNSVEVFLRLITWLGFIATNLFLCLISTTRHENWDWVKKHFHICNLKTERRSQIILNWENSRWIVCQISLCCALECQINAPSRAC